MYCYIWEFRVDAEHDAEFRAAYGDAGEWVALFRRDPHYIRTELLRDRDDPSRYLTIDYWTSREACLSFRATFETEFESIDRKYEAITQRETPLGEFELI